MKNENDKRGLDNNKAQKRQQLQEGNEDSRHQQAFQKVGSMRKATSYQILPAAEVIMNNENYRRNLGNNMAHKKGAVRARQRVQTDPPNSGGHYEK